MFDGTADPGGSLILAEGIAGVVPTGRNTDLHPINANKYRKISFRMKADVGPAGVPGGFFWYSCDHIIPDCENGFPFTVHNGWNNYSFDIPSQGARFHPGGPAWGGTLKGLRFVPSGNSQTHIQLDYVRLTPSSGSDAPPAAPVPLPVVDSPSLAGGFDYATLVRRDAWDMSQPSDISGPENMVYGFGNGLLNGLSVAPNYGDPHFSLPLAGPIDANRFHRLTFNVFYEGPPGVGLRTRRRDGRPLDLADRGRARRLAEQRRHRGLSGLERHQPRSRDVSRLRDHRARDSGPHRVGRPADHVTPVRPRRGLRRPPIPRRQHQGGGGRDGLQRPVRRQVPRRRVATRHDRRHLQHPLAWRLRRDPDRAWPPR